ncbi:MAG: hypothetical protein V3T72_21485 [Thermoanaerobaculia bacterium]
MSNRVSRLLFPLAVAGVCSLMAPGVVLAQGPFACTGEAYIVQDSATPGIDGQLTQIDQSVSPFTFVDVGTPQVEYNNIGFNPADGFIYALELTTTGNAGVHRVGNDGSITNLGVPTGTCDGGGVSFPISPSSARFDAGDVNDLGTRLFVNAAGSGRLFILDITVTPPAVVDCPTITGDTGRVNDWAFNEADGNLYGGDRDDSDQVARIDLASYAGGATITRTDFADTGLGLSGTEAFGGAWFDALGTLFLYRNGGIIFEVIDVTGGTPTMEVVDSQLGPGSSRNDGAACAQDVVGAAKSMMTNSPASLPATITIDYVFENFSTTLPLTLLSALDDLTAVFGTHVVDWTFISASSVPAALGNPAFNGHAVTELINQAPTQSLAALATGSITVTITLLTDAADTDMDDTYCNQAVLTGDLGGVMFGDTSTDGSDPDPDMDGIPVERDLACIMQIPVELQSFSVD